MDFIKNIDLNAVCRILDYVAVIILVLGIIGSIVLGIHQNPEFHYHKETVIEWPVILCGICASFLNCLFCLLLSRIGDAIDDIRNKYVSEEIKPSIEQ